jgi:hypothetical protein
MLNNAAAEWILRRCTSQDRAASIVGDLVELKAQKGAFWFWLSLMGVTLSLVWQRPLAFIAALYTGTWAFSAFQMAIWGVHAQHRPGEYFWMPVFSVLTGFGSMLWAVLLYSAIRYGLNDRVTQLTFALTGLVTAVIYLWWQPVVLAICIVVSICVISASILTQKYRRAIIVPFVTFAVSMAASIVAGLIDLQSRHIIYPDPIGDRELRAHPSIVWVDFACLLMVAWMTTTAFSRTHNYLLRKQSTDPEIEDTQLLQ